MMIATDDCPLTACRWGAIGPLVGMLSSGVKGLDKAEVRSPLMSFDCATDCVPRGSSRPRCDLPKEADYLKVNPTVSDDTS